MKVISRIERAQLAYSRWQSTYQSGYKELWGSDKEKIGSQLRDMREAAMDGAPLTPEMVNEVIGNTSWTSVECDECGKQVESAMMVGQEEDHDSRTATICLLCLKKAVALLENNP